MDAGVLTAEQPKSNLTKVSEKAANMVFQPQKLKEVVDIIDLMGNVATRVREDSSGDMSTGTGVGGQQRAQQGAIGTSARDEAIAKAPPIPVMQQKLVEHIEREVTQLRRQMRSVERHASRPGAAYALNELYKKVRRLTTLISSLLHASSEMIKRFYISVFIDKQPIVVTGGTLLQMED